MHTFSNFVNTAICAVQFGNITELLYLCNAVGLMIA